MDILKISSIREIDNKVRELERKGIKITKLHIGSPNLKSPDFLSKICNILPNYTSFGGSEEAKEAVRNVVESLSGQYIENFRISLVNGGMHGVLVSLAKLKELKIGRVFLPNPGFRPYYDNICYLLELKIENYDLKNIPIVKKDEAILINNPHNPTGRVIRKKKLEDIVSKSEGVVIFDHPYWKLARKSEDTDIFDLLEYKNIIIILSLSKLFSIPGYRAGAVISKIDVSNMVLNTTTMCNTLGQQAWIEVSEHIEDAKEYLERSRKTYIKRLEIAYRILSKHFKLDEPEGAFYLFPNVEYNGNKFALKLLEEKGISVAPGGDFGSGFDNYIRISVSAVDEQTLREALKRIVLFSRG